MSHGVPPSSPMSAALGLPLTKPCAVEACAQTSASQSGGLQQCMPSWNCTAHLLCREDWAAREAMPALKGCCPTPPAGLLPRWLEEALEALRWGRAAS